MKPSNLFFQNVADFMTFLEKPISKFCEPYDPDVTTASEFNGNTSFQKACQLARYGWPEAPKLEAMLVQQFEEYAYEYEYVRNERHYDVAGDEVDVSLYCSGEVECMVTYTRRRTTSTARLVFNIGAACSERAEALIARGALALALVEAFDRMGISTEIVAKLNLQHIHKPKLITEIALKLKELEDPVDVDRLGFWLGHPASLRVMFLSIVSRLPNEECASLGSCYGIPQPVCGISQTDYVFNHLPQNIQEAQSMLIECLSTLSNQNEK
jgi:hypothetical protein